MKKFQRLLVALMMLALVFTLAVPAFAEGESESSNVQEYVSGDTYDFQFDVSGKGVDGYFEYSGTESVMTDNETTSTGGMSGSVDGSNAGRVYMTENNSNMTDESIGFSGTVQGNVGDEVTVTWHYRTTDDNDELSDWQTQSQTIRIVAPTDTPAPTATPAPSATATPAPSATNTPAPSATNTPAPSATNTPAPSATATPRPYTPTGGTTGGSRGGGTGTGTGQLDYTELEKQIQRPEDMELIEGDYTKDSWKDMADALEAGRDLLYNAKTQEEIDEAAKLLKEAIDNLVPMDYSKLEEAIKSGADLRDDTEFGKLWAQLFDALQRGLDLIGSGDQEAVDACAAEIQDLIEKIQKALDENMIEKEVEVEKIVEKEVAKEVYPDEPYCSIWPNHIPLHWILPILLGLSLAGNVAQIIVAATKKKKKEQDDTPVVAYNIDEDS